MATVAPTAPAPARDVIKVNNANLIELKNACDDALKRYLSRPDLYKQDYTHTDVRLVLGWLAVIAAGGTGLYGWKIEFEEAKPVVWVGVLLYFALTTAQTLYAYFVEGSTVFVGKRKTLDKRIVTERITISSYTDHTAPAPKTGGPCPSYALDASVVRTASGGKALLNQDKHIARAPYSRFFDADGVLDQELFETWVAELVSKASA